MYGQYIKEREDFDILEDDYGFATYKIINNECYLRDIFVIKQFRQHNHATKLADTVSKIAKDAGCLRLLGTVAPSASGSSLSMKLLLDYGMRLKSSSNDFIVLEKDL
jgi:GNAT superfamily N-acetyltransferase